MGRTRSHRALSEAARAAGTAPDRAAELEAKLTAMEQELERSRLQHQEDSAGFAQALARLAQSERGLSQTKAKLVDAESRAARAEARLVAAEAHRAAAEAQASELEARLLEVEAREREALIAAEDARDERAAAMAEVEQLKRQSLQREPGGGANDPESRELRRRLAAAEERVDTLSHERARLLELLASLEVLGREISHLTQQAVPVAAGLPKVEAWLGRDVEAEHVRATVRPEAFSAPPPQASRTWSTPELVIDGVKQTQ